MENKGSLPSMASKTCSSYFRASPAVVFPPIRGHDSRADGVTHSRLSLPFVSCAARTRVSAEQSNAGRGQLAFEQRRRHAPTRPGIDLSLKRAGGIRRSVSNAPNLTTASALKKAAKLKRSRAAAEGHESVFLALSRARYELTIWANSCRWSPIFSSSPKGKGGCHR